jgi:pilus assembly protein CpaE
MIDLNSILNKKLPTSGNTDSSNNKTNNSVFLYSSDICCQLVSEAYQYQGLPAPSQQKYSIDKVKRVVANKAKTLLIELASSDDITSEAKQISHIVPHDILVIIIGAEDAISTIRNLKSLGFYYLFWPFNKQELIDFVRNISATYDLDVALKHQRNAKRIAVIGSKGGVGCTLLAAEIASLLSLEHKTSCLLVDHSQENGNCDIMLGSNTLKKRELILGTLSETLDDLAAKNLTTRVNDQLSYLGLNIKEQIPQAVAEFSEQVVAIIAKSLNFVIEDVSSSVSFSQDATWLCRENDCLILLLEPTVSSVRSAKKMSIRLNEAIKKSGKSIKLLFVLNHHRSKTHSAFSEQEISKVLGTSIDHELPFEAHTDKILLTGQRLYTSSAKLAQPLQNLVTEIMGGKVKKQSWLASKHLPFLTHKSTTKA